MKKLTSQEQLRRANHAHRSMWASKKEWHLLQLEKRHTLAGELSASEREKHVEAIALCEKQLHQLKEN